MNPGPPMKRREGCVDDRDFRAAVGHEVKLTREDEGGEWCGIYGFFDLGGAGTFSHNRPVVEL